MELNFEDFDQLVAPVTRRLDVQNGAAEYSRLQYLVDNTPAIIYASVPSGDFRMTYVSNNAFNVLGYLPEQMIDDPNFWYNHIHPDDIASIFSSLAMLFTEGQRTYEYRFLKSTGEYLWVHDMLRLIRDEEQNPVEVIGSLTDITTRKKMEDDLRERGQQQQLLIQKLQDTQQQLLQAEKMASVGQLAAGVAHEINNPIGFVNANISTLKSYVGTLFKVIERYKLTLSELTFDEMTKKELDTISKNADLDFVKTDIGDLVDESLEGLNRVKGIVQSLKDFSHVGETEWQEADLHQGIENTLNVVKKEFKNKTDIDKRFGEIPLVDCVISEMNQVFLNLLVNAAHAIKDKGIIGIKTGRETWNGTDAVFVKIFDTGCGIAPENINRIFEPFFTTKPVGSGTGLGLSLAYSIINKHNGHIAVRSVMGKGTEFTIRLPVKQPKLM